MLESDTVVEQAIANGLKVQRVGFSDQDLWVGRFLLIENKPCQIFNTQYRVSNPRSPEALSIPLALPRNDWPDFLIYAVRPSSAPLECYIIPRGFMSRSTTLAPQTVEKYRNDWGRLKETPTPDQVERRFTILSWQLQRVVTATEEAGLEIILLRRRPPRRLAMFLQTRVMVAGRRCELHSLSRFSANFVALRKQKDDWAEFQLYVLRGPEPCIYVFPRGSIRSDTTTSLDNEKLSLYKNAWNLLSESNETARPSVEFKRIPKPPKELPIALRETKRIAEELALSVEDSNLSNKCQILISGKRCQIMQTKPNDKMMAETGRAYVPVNLPKHDWAEFLILFIKPDGKSTTGEFYIVPRNKLTKPTMVSPTSSWLKEYAGAWHLLRQEVPAPK